MATDTIARLAIALSMDAGEFVAGSTVAQKTLSEIQGRFKSFGDQWSNIGKKLTIGVTVPFGAIAVSSAKAASDFQELDSAYTQTFGNLSSAMKEWARTTGDAMGRSTQEIQQAANTFGIFFNQAAPTRKEASEMSKTFAVLAQDLSSFYNVSPGDALDKLRSGLSGESEPLRDFGVFLNEAAVKSKGLEMGLGGLTGELTEQEKIMARYALILESTTNAQGDVARTSSGTANQARSFNAALDELRVTIGEKLLPIITPLIEMATSLLNRFNGLPSGVQTAIVAMGAFAAALGPMMLVTGTLAATLLPLFAARFGPIGLAISAFINPIGTAVSLLAQFAIQMGGMTVLKTVGAMFLRFAGPVGMVATAGLLIYNNWGRISAVFQEFWKTAQATLGPPLQELTATVSRIFDELMSGPLGEGIRGAIQFMKDFGGVASNIFGDVVVAVLKVALDVVIAVFRQIGDALRFVNALLQGDFANAWRAAASFIVRALGPFGALAVGAVQSMQNLYNGVRTWLIDKLGAVFNSLRDKVRAATGFFNYMYIAVVGNSYVPDMVTEIGLHMNRLQAVMVDPAQKATASVTEATRQMASEVASLLDRLFPQLAEARRQASDIALLRDAEKSGLISSGTRRAGVRELQGLNEGPLAEARKVNEAAEDFKRTMAGLGDNAEIQTVRVARTFQDMAEGVVSSLQRLTSSIKGGGFLDILGAVIGLGTQLGQLGVFGKTVQANLNKPIPGFANGTNYAPGGLALVGERGPELVNLPRGAGVMSNRELRNLGGSTHVTVGIDPRNGNITAFVNGQIAANAPAIASAGAAMAQGQMAQAARRRVR